MAAKENLMVLGCGDIGLDVAAQMLAKGHQVTAVRRSATPVSLPRLNLVQADITDREQLNTLPTDAKLIAVILAPQRRNKDSYQAIFQCGINNLLEYLARHSLHPPRFVFVSSTSVYGQRQGEWVDEQSCTEPDTYNGKSLLAAEQAILSSGDSSVIRFSGIYGGSRTRLLQQVKAGVPVQYHPPYYSNRIHREDCIAALVWLLEKMLLETKPSKQAIDRIYLGSDSEPAPIGEITTWLANKTGLPQPPAKLSGGDRVSQNKRCRNQRLLDQGFRFKYPNYRDGFAQMQGI